METINHECYVSIEIANLLKEAGFDWKCHGIYVLDSENDPKYVFSTANFTNISKEIEGYIRLSAPTLGVVQRWLREVKKIHIEASPENDEYTEWLVCVYDSNHTAYSGYKTYEEALEAGIKKCFELISKKK